MREEKGELKAREEGREGGRKGGRVYLPTSSVPSGCAWPT